jgi:hypothetical protein
MKNTHCIGFLLAPLLLGMLASGTSAQSAGDPAIPASEAEEIAAARNRYTATKELLPTATDRATLAQYSRRGRGQPFPPRGRYPREQRYDAAWMHHGNPAQAAIGAAIGFGIGATAGAIGCARNGTPVGSGILLGGSLFALIGGAIGASHGAGYRFAHHRKNSPLYSPGDNEKDQEARRKSDPPRPPEELQIPRSMSAATLPSRTGPGSGTGYRR